MVRDDEQLAGAGGQQKMDGLRRALRAYSSEFLLYVSREGEIAAGSTDRVLGYSFDRIGSHVGEFLHPDDLPQLFELIERARGITHYRDRIQVRARHADGSWRVLDAAIFEVPHDDGGPLAGGAVIRVRDITDEAAWAEGAPTEDRDRFLSLAESLPLGILSADSRGWVVFCNDAAQQIFNLSAEHLVGHGWERLVHPEDRPEVMGALGAVVRNGLPQQVLFRIQTGLFVRWAMAKFVPLGPAGQHTGWIGTVDDVTDRRRTETELTHKATHDRLTGLPNRMLLEDRFQQACARMRPGQAPLSVLFIDLDGFKAVNDTYGHSVGDQVLVEVAGRLRRIMRTVDTVARVGGDEFVAFCESLPEVEVREIVQRIHDTIGIPLMIDGDALHLGASIGVESTNSPRMTLAELLVRADQAMYRQKRQR